MSNLSQFVGGGFPIGGGVAIPYNGDVYTSSDGTQWYSNTPTSPFAYTSAYSYLPDSMVSSHPIMTGPEANGTWMPYTATFNIAYNPTAPLYCTAPYQGNTFNGWTYYTSADGSTWTSRTFPNPSVTYTVLCYTAGKFIGVAPSTTTNGLITSTDGINWTSFNISSIFAGDVASNGSTNIVVIPYASTTGMYSIDSGASWASFTIANTSSFQAAGQGGITWNAGAGLFIVVINAAGAYSTSPTGATWTSRSAQSTFTPYSARFNGNHKFASNSTTTVCVGLGGFFATSTDGLTWSNHGLISDTWGNSGAPHQVYYDGTRFVVRYQQRVWYSTDGTTWTEGKPIGGHTLVIPQSNGVLFAFPLLAANVMSKMLNVSDVTLTTRQTILSSVLHVQQTTIHTHYRIR